MKKITSTLVAKKSERGFSLVELMIVVAIIGILAAIGIPQFSKYQAKARQSEAKSSLSSLYAAQQSFTGEYGTYSPDLAIIGYGVSGTGLRYVTGFSATTAMGSWPTNAPALPVAPAFQSNMIAYQAATAPAWVPILGIAAGNVAVNFAGTAPVVAAATVAADGSTYTAVSFGIPGSPKAGLITGNNSDIWTINQSKNILNNRMRIDNY